MINKKTFKTVGGITFRASNNDKIQYIYGHIGYDVKPKYQSKGYAS